ncbi:response regulator [Ekhidna sp.]|uniref:response regulator n=1 Tax=Ekhidna sp. TaxID=2608089 RepID=UPI003CCBD25A
MIKSVLLVDDDPANNFVHKLMITRLGLADEIVAMESVKEALDYLETEHPDVILLDINMPALSGWDFMDRFSSMNIASETKVYMVSSSVNPEDRERAVKNDLIADFIEKPLKAEHLRQMLA